jgi:undecaprenyl pyrophosphate phosphatase UppP
LASKLPGFHREKVLIMFLLQLALALIVVAVVGWLINTVITVPGNVKPIVNVVLALILVGIALELINTYIPMAGSIKAILNVVVVVATCVGVFQAFGLWNRMLRMWTSFTTKHQISE